MGSTKENGNWKQFSPSNGPSADTIPPKHAEGIELIEGFLCCFLLIKTFQREKKSYDVFFNLWTVHDKRHR